LDESVSQIDKLVVVVHGVGDPEPGETLGSFARSLAEDHHPLGEQQTTVWLPEKSRKPGYVQTFPTHVRQLDNGEEKIELAELFWGDLSRVWFGLPGAIVGIFQILFGLRYVAYVAADQPGIFAMWLKRLGLISSKIIHGPVLAVTFFLAILAFACSGTQLMWADSYKSMLWTQVVLAGCCAFAIASSSVGWRMTHSRVCERFWFWVNVTAMFVGGLMIVKTIWIDPTFPAARFTGEIKPGLIWYCRVLVLLLGLLWFTEIIVLASMAGCWLGALFHPQSHWPSLHVGLLLPALSVGIWGQLLPMIWLAAKGAIRNLLNLKEFDALFHEAIPLMGVQFLMVVAMAIATMLIGYRFVRWRTRFDIADFALGKRPPRLIVHGFLQLVLATCSFIGISLIFTIGLLQFRGLDYQDWALAKFMAESNKYAMAILVPSSFAMIFLIPRLRPVFDIVLDVVNHFYFRPIDVQDTLDDEDEFDISETTFEHGTLFFSRRETVHSRLRRVLDYYNDTLDNRPDLVFVAHSQGTMIAIEVLNDPDMAWLTNRFRSVSLVTMGSPFSNLYQHYFAKFYPPLDQPFWSSLRKRLDRWINVFRIDDPVGTEIHFPARNVHDLESCQRIDNGYCGSSISTSSRPPYSNHPVGCRGHVHYWNDCEVLEILRAELFVSCQPQRRQQAA
jgi:hypothetical protein